MLKSVQVAEGAEDVDAGLRLRAWRSSTRPDMCIEPCASSQLDLKVSLERPRDVLQ